MSSRRAVLRRADLAALLERHGGLFSAHLGIDLRRRHRGELFKWFLASMLFGARISETIAVRTYRAFEDHRLLTPERLGGAPFDELLEIMAEGGYVRYDGITSRKTQDAATKLLAEYGGDLNRLHDAARDGDDLVARLMEFRGVGPVTANIFLRELRGVWPKADPPVGALAALAAGHLGMADAAAWWRRHCIEPYEFRHFEAALTRIGRGYCRRGRCRLAPVPHDAV